MRGLGNGNEQKNKNYRWMLLLKKESRPVQVSFEKPEEKENTYIAPLFETFYGHCVFIKLAVQIHCLVWM
jgi:uncharacterized protein (DUF169 family)